MAAQREPHPDRLPIKLDSTSNGEFEPVPLDAAPRHACALAHEAIDAGARRVAASRRGYLQSLLGAAATLGAFNKAFAAAGQRGGALRAAGREPLRDDGGAGGARRR